MRALTLLLFTVVVATTASAQSIGIYDIDTSSFPTMSARLFAFDADGNQASPAGGDITVTENGVTRSLTAITCPLSSTIAPLSAVLVMDVSGSMGRGPDGVPNLELARTAATAWIERLPDVGSECALTTFDDGNYLNQDFTRNRQKLLDALTLLKPGGGTDYDKGFLLPIAGGLHISRNGRYQRVIVFLTDGQPNIAPKTKEIIEEARNQNCIVYAVTLGMPCPASLKAITEATGGGWFENVTTPKQATDVYMRILREAQGAMPCRITWQSGPTCVGGARDLVVSWNGVSVTEHYMAPLASIASLEFAPASLYIRSKPVGVPFDTTVRVTARNAQFAVATITGSNPAYQISPSSFTLASGESRTLTIRYTPPDSGYTSTTFDIATDICPQKYGASGGYPGMRPLAPTLQVVYPNGGETLLAGTDTTIRWRGISVTTPIRLEYSIDGGNAWMVIADSVTGGAYRWNVPVESSDRCLVRAVHLFSSDEIKEPLVTIKGHSYWVNGVTWSPDGRSIATASEDGTAKVWDAASGEFIRELEGRSSHYLRVAWSPDGGRIASTSRGGDTTDHVKIHDATSGALLYEFRDDHGSLLGWNTSGSMLATAFSGQPYATIWNGSDGTMLQRLDGHTEVVTSATWSPDGTRVITTGRDAIAQIWDVTTGQRVQLLSGSSDALQCATWSPDGTMVATACLDHTIRIWNVEDGSLLHSIDAHSARIDAIAWSPDGSTIGSVSWDNTAKLWSAVTGTRVHTLAGHKEKVTSLAWNPDGTVVATASWDGTVKLWDARNGKPIKTLTHDGWVTAVVWRFDGEQVATASYDRTVKIWDAKIAMQDDTSDALFSIVQPSMVSRDVEMGDRVVGSAGDLLCPGFVRNEGAYPTTVRQIRITGADASQFTLVSGIPPFDVAAGEARDVEFGFRPTSPGLKSARVTIITRCDTIRKTIRGVGIAPSVSTLSEVVDFGRSSLGNRKDSTVDVALHNSSSFPIEVSGMIDLGPDKTQFILLSEERFTLEPGTSRSVSVRFAPRYIGRTSGRIGFVHDGAGSPAVIQLFGEGIGGIVSVASDSGFVGARHDVTIRLQSSDGASVRTASATRYRARLVYNRTLLFPIEGAVASGAGFDTLSIGGAIVPGDLLATIPFVVMLGNADSTTIDIVDLQWLDDNDRVAEYDADVSGGVFRLRGLRNEGGMRLIDPFGEVRIIGVTPNPMRGIAEITIETIESGRTRLSLYNALGEEAAIIHDGELSPGRHRLTLDSATFPAGSYTLVLTTPTVVRSAPLQATE